MDQRIARRRDVPAELVLVTVISKRFLRGTTEGEPTRMRVIDTSIYGAAIADENTQVIKPGDELVIEHDEKRGHAVVRNVTTIDASTTRLGVELADDGKEIFAAIRMKTAEAA